MDTRAILSLGLHFDTPKMIELICAVEVLASEHGQTFVEATGLADQFVMSSISLFRLPRTSTCTGTIASFSSSW